MNRALKIAGWTLLAFVLAAAASFAWLDRPVGTSEFASHPAPLASYSAAVARISATGRYEDRLPLAPVGHSIAMLHGSRTETAVVVIHGYTNMPSQFALIEKGYYDSGANVWAPRMPYHGYSDRMTGDLAKLTPEKIAAYSDSAIDVGHGLGRHVVVIGLSGGGTIASWAAAERPDVTQAVVMAPLLLPKGMPAWSVRPFARALMVIPNVFEWWDSKLKTANPGPAYQRFATRGIASFLLLGQRAIADAQRRRYPARGDIVLLANANDESVDPTYAITAEKLIAAPTHLGVIVIPTAAGIHHDIVNVLGNNRPKIRECYRYISKAAGIPLPDPLSGK